jgi:hypothetical protein
MNNELEKIMAALPGMPVMSGVEDPYFSSASAIQLGFEGGIKFVFPPEMEIVDAYKEFYPEVERNVAELQLILKAKHCRWNPHFARVCLKGSVLKTGVRPPDATRQSLVKSQAGVVRKCKRTKKKRTLRQNHLQMTASPTMPAQESPSSPEVIQITRYSNGGSDNVLYKSIEETSRYIIVEKR